MTDPRMFHPPVEPTFVGDDGTTATRRDRGAIRKYGDNKPLLQIKSPILQVLCGAHVFAVVHRRHGLDFLLVSQNEWPVPGWDGRPLKDPEWDSIPAPGGCPCGRMHTLDVARVREAAARLRREPPKRRIVGVSDVSV